MPFPKISFFKFKKNISGCSSGNHWC